MKLMLQWFSSFWIECNSCNVFLSHRCKMMSLERKCSDGVERSWCFWKEAGVHNVFSPLTFGGNGLSLSSPQNKHCSFHNGYSKYSRETLRLLFPGLSRRLWLLCVFSDKKQSHEEKEMHFAKSWSAERSDETELTLCTWNLFFQQHINEEKSFVKTKWKDERKWMLPWGDFLLVQKWILCWDLL